jgi:hypothetical protein
MSVRIGYDENNNRIFLSIEIFQTEVQTVFASRVAIITNGILTTIISDYESSSKQTIVRAICCSVNTYFWENNYPNPDSIDLFYIYGNTSKKTGKQYIYWNNPENFYRLSDEHPADAGLLNIADGYIIAINIDGVCHPAWNVTANQVVGSAYIMNAAIGDLQVDSISASKIKADTVMTPGVTIGGMRILPGTEDPATDQEAGLYINSEKFGYYRNGWATYQDKDGNFVFGVPGFPDRTIKWNCARGQLIVGHNNIVIDANENCIWISKDGGHTFNDFALLKDGSIELYKFINGQHVRYTDRKSVV